MVVERSRVPAHFPTFNRCLLWLRSRRPPRVLITVGRAMIVVAVVGLVCGAIRWYMPESPQVLALRQKVKYHQKRAKAWGRFATLSEEGRTTLRIGSREDESRGEVLALWNFTPRPKDAEGEKAYNRRCAAIAARCREMQDYHDRLRRKWDRAVSEPWEKVALDPDPPLSPDMSPLSAESSL